MRLQDIARWRLASQQLIQPHHARPEHVVGALGAMQAQDYPGVLWSVGLRLPQATEASLEQAIRERKIVRTWPLRGTLHLVAAADVRWMLAWLAPRIIAGSAGRQRQLELDEAIFARCRKLFVRALAKQPPLTREAMMQLMEQNQISTAGQRGYHILWRLAQEGVLCFAARAGKEHTFALLDDWIPAARILDREEALTELAHRYFTGHGPATVKDFAWWAGLKISDARAGLDHARSKLASETVAGVTYWMAPGLPDLAFPKHTALLLPGFDELLLGYGQRDAALDPKHAAKIVPGNNGMFLPTLVLDGRVAGTWKRTIRKKAVAIHFSPFTGLKKTDREALLLPAQRYGEFLGLPVNIAAH